MPTDNPGLGILLALVSGVLLGAFALPMKKTCYWKWENTWLAYCFWSLIVFSWLLAWATVPGFLAVLRAAPLHALLPVFLFGAGWGAGCVMFGMALQMSGLALGNAITLGLNNALGTLLPVLLYNREQLATSAGLMLSAGVLAMLAGVALCSWAGSARQGSLASGGNSPLVPGEDRIRKGVLLAILAGFLGTMFNFALVFGDTLRTLAERAGARPLYANNAVWCVSLFGGFLVNGAYCGYLLTRNRGWTLFSVRHARRNWLLSIAMAGMWMGGVAIYGMAVSQLGRLGPSIGWALIQSTAILAGNLVGLLAGEWKNAGPRFRPRMITGLALLVAGIAVVAASAFVPSGQPV